MNPLTMLSNSYSNNNLDEIKIIKLFEIVLAGPSNICLKS